ncbi:hypothetical protein EST38_g8848 [Candolleomyces aberdarensis]|uniref:Uncharacterized protein n=1 Tax=Candolleomyces aberdarensis TaxID=2316362 RepID=A0A4Q2DDR2_9AGAR|nr:hypothetical protein EST38_g8848 [Candolleomyces aberdarensis]
MIFEIVLFGFALYKSARSLTINTPLQDRPSLTAVLLGDNILYFLGISTLLILLNIMSVGTTLIPWFGFGPFHAGLGIMTTRMLMHLRKATVSAELVEFDKTCDSNSEEIDIDEALRGIDGTVPKFIVSTSTRSSLSSFSSSVSSLEVDVEQFAGSSGSQATMTQGN